MTAVEKNSILLTEILSSRLYNRLNNCLLYRIKEIEHKRKYTLEDLLFIDESEVKGLRNVGIVLLNEFIYWKNVAIEKNNYKINNMSPTEKAKELYNKFSFTAKSFIWGKQCAILAVDEILKAAFYATDEIYDYYLEVKIELEKL